jgi:hypothetical protein
MGVRVALGDRQRERDLEGASGHIPISEIGEGPTREGHAVGIAILSRLKEREQEDPSRLGRCGLPIVRGIADLQRQVADGEQPGRRPPLDSVTVRVFPQPTSLTSIAARQGRLGPLDGRRPGRVSPTAGLACD